jgi:hypothetical protein
LTAARASRYSFDLGCVEASVKRIRKAIAGGIARARGIGPGERVSGPKAVKFTVRSGDVVISLVDNPRMWEPVTSSVSTGIGRFVRGNAAELGIHIVDDCSPFLIGPETDRRVELRETANGEWTATLSGRYPETSRTGPDEALGALILSRPADFGLSLNKEEMEQAVIALRNRNT